MARLLHRRMRHLNYGGVSLLPETAKEEFQVRTHKKELCEVCVMAKRKWKPNRVPAERAKRVGQRIHADLCGGGYTFASKELQQSAEFEKLPSSEGGAKYFIVITDDFSRYCKTVPLKHKNEAEEAIKELINEIEAKEHRTEAIRKDGGGEFGSKKFDKWLKEKGIKIEDSAPYTPEQNGLSERSVGIVCEKARSMLLASDLPETMWAEAVVTATYLINRSRTRSLKRGVTPFEAFHGEKPSISHIREFGCTAYGKIPPQKVRGKLTPRSKKMKLVGFESTNIYRLWDPEDRRISRIKNVEFNEEEMETSKNTVS
jgi:transposase InsO family protein